MAWFCEVCWDQILVRDAQRKLDPFWFQGCGEDFLWAL